MNIHDSVIAGIRTGVAALVGLLVTWLVSQGIQLDESVKGTLTIALVAVVIALYNWLVVLLERKVSPWFGLLLGVPKTPAYAVETTSNTDSYPWHEVEPSEPEVPDYGE